jgi:hypothetical protein
MRFYGVVGRPAEAALAAMPKVAGASVGELSVVPGAVTAVFTPSQQPIDKTVTITLKNVGNAPLTYTLTLQPSPPLALSLSAPLSGLLDPNEATAVPLQFSLAGQPTGSYSGALHINTTSNGVAGSQNLPLMVFLWDEIYHTFLPVVIRP